jgi:alanine racemase
LHPVHKVKVDKNSIIRPSWIEIDMNAIEWNARQIKNYLGDVKVLAVVKADAYGLGACPVAQLLIRCGVAKLGVVALDEAIELRQTGISAPILNMGEILPEHAPLVVQYDVEQMAYQKKVVEAISRAAQARGVTARLHFKIDTGMSRYGAPHERALATFQDLQKFAAIEFVGVMSHFAMSDAQDKSYSNMQIERFQQAKLSFERAGIHIPLWHMCNSGGTLDLPRAHFDMVRVGLMFYGYFPSTHVRKPFDLKPAMSVRTKIVSTRTIQPGVSVGYSRRFTAEKEERIGVCPIGYSDGYDRKLRNTGQVLLKGKRVPILGGLCMDACFIQLTDVSEADIGDVVTLMGADGEDQISPHEIAGWIQSVSYEVMSTFGRRLPRVYLREGKIVETRNYLLE